MFAERPDRSVGKKVARSGKFVRKSPGRGNRWGKPLPKVSRVAGEPTIRRAEAGDEPRMREIAAEAKGHWGYDAERVSSWAASLELARLEEAWVADGEQGVVAWMAILPGPSVCILDHLWVDPKFMDRGLGSALFERAVERARELGGNWLQWESEPNATGFYEKLGGVQVGATLGSWGRELPVMQLDLTG